VQRVQAAGGVRLPNPCPPPRPQYVRWYINGVFVYEVTKEALAGVENAAGQAVGDRLIPVEAMQIIFNLGLRWVRPARLPAPRAWGLCW